MSTHYDNSEADVVDVLDYFPSAMIKVSNHIDVAHVRARVSAIRE